MSIFVSDESVRTASSLSLGDFFMFMNVSAISFFLLVLMISSVVMLLLSAMLFSSIMPFCRYFPISIAKIARTGLAGRAGGLR